MVVCEVEKRDSTRGRGRGGAGSAPVEAEVGVEEETTREDLL